MAAAGVAVEDDRIAEHLEWLLAAARGQGDLPVIAITLTMRAMLRQRRGAVMPAAADADAAIEALTLAGMLPFRPMAIALRIYCHLERGNVAEVWRLLEHHGCRGPLDDSTTFHSILGHARGLANLAEGRIPEAIFDLRDVGRRMAICSWTCPSEALWRSDLALALVEVGQLDEARDLVARELDLARSFGTPRLIGMALRAVGLVDGDKRAGEATLREAVAVLAGSSSRLDLARTLVDLGSMMRRRGARAEAREPLTRGLDLASGCGGLAVAERARAELVASGARPRRSRSVGVESLTVTEARTADLAASGATNKQIAQSMFVTVKTVESHLAHVYQKLGISKRADLARALQVA